MRIIAFSSIPFAVEVSFLGELLMRSRFFCWSRTLALLGYRRVPGRRTSVHSMKLGRTSVIESLEPRQLLTAAPIDSGFAPWIVDPTIVASQAYRAGHF